MGITFNELIDVSLRAIISLISLFVVAKFIGKKQVSELSLFDYVIGISIGNFAAEITINLEANMIYGVLGVLIFGFASYLVSIITMKSIKLRRFFMGTPTILIDQGNIVLNALKKVKFDINDLLEECRSNGYFDIKEINYALMEANGKLSILPKAKYKPANLNDLQLKVNENSLLANIIIDGKIMKQNLKNMNKDEKWLLNQLKVKNKKLENILLCTLDNNSNIEIYLKNDNYSKDILE